MKNHTNHTIIKNFSLGKDERLKSRKLIEQLFNEGKHLSVFPFKINYLLGKAILPAPKEKSSPLKKMVLQFGTGVSAKHFKRAVDRNRIKRITREAYRLQKPFLYELLHQKELQLAVFIIYTGRELPAHELVSEKIALILFRLSKEVNA